MSYRIAVAPDPVQTSALCRLFLTEEQMVPLHARLRLSAIVAIGLLCATAAPAPAQDHEGIKVHGRWAIDVRNADGSLASHHEFNNSLVVGGTIGGSGVLAGLLGRSFTVVGDWHVLLGGAEQPCGQATSRQACRISEPTFPNASPNVNFRNLRVTVPTHTVSFPAIGAREIPNGTVELAGEATAALDGSISQVNTQMGLCNTGTNCFMVSDVTAHTLAAAIAVVAGQIIQVKVVLSFS